MKKGSGKVKDNTSINIFLNEMIANKCFKFLTLFAERKENQIELTSDELNDFLLTLAQN